MLDFLKRFGLGVVYVLIAPFVLVFLLGWTAYALGIFVVEIFKGLKSFFKGKKFFEEFPEDIEAERILSLEPYDAPNAENVAINVPTMDQNNEDKPL